MIPNEKLNEILNNIIQSDHLRKKNVKIYIPLIIIKKSRKLENWKYFSRLSSVSSLYGDQAITGLLKSCKG